MSNKSKKKKVKIRYKRVIVLFTFIFFIIFLCIYIKNIKITNIYIKGNNLLNDQEIIDITFLSNYPESIKNPSWKIEERLEKNIYILNANVSKKGITKVYIEVEENIPILYNSIKNKTVLKDGTEVLDKFDVPILVNYIPDTIYDNFIKELVNIDNEILKRISEIKYDPSDVDDERFLLSMVDGNYVYLTLNRFDAINNYIVIIKNFDNKKGILNLDVGNVFKYFD